MVLINDGRPFLRSEAADVGLSISRLDGTVRAGLLRAVVRGCYVDARVPDSIEMRIACVERCRPPEAVAADITASFLRGLDVRPPGQRFDLTPHFVVPHATTRLEYPGVHCRQALIDPEDIDVLPGGLPVTTPIRTTSDLLRGLHRPYALAAADAFARAGLIDVDELIDYVHRLKGYRWIVQARGLSVLVDSRAMSPGESWTRLRIHDAGFPPPELQHLVEDHLGRRRFLDLAYPRLRIACEYDGREFHSLDADRIHDALRREDLTDVLDWRWIVATRSSIFGTDTAFEDELGHLLGMTPRPRTWGRY